MRYRLWPETIRLLQQERAQFGELMLTNENGNPLKVEKIVGEKTRKSDAIRLAFARVGAKSRELKHAPRLA